jgi:hypothetical protein
VLVFVEIHSGQQRQLSGFFPEFHGQGSLPLSQDEVLSTRCAVHTMAP